MAAGTGPRLWCGCVSQLGDQCGGVIHLPGSYQAAGGVQHFLHLCWLLRHRLCLAPAGAARDARWACPVLVPTMPCVLPKSLLEYVLPLRCFDDYASGKGGSVTCSGLSWQMQHLLTGAVLWGDMAYSIFSAHNCLQMIICSLALDRPQRQGPALSCQEKIGHIMLMLLACCHPRALKLQARVASLYLVIWSRAQPGAGAATFLLLSWQPNGQHCMICWYS